MDKKGVLKKKINILKKSCGLHIFKGIIQSMKKQAVKTFGILTSGGDAPGLNAAIRGVCRSAMINYGMKIV